MAAAPPRSFAPMRPWKVVAIIVLVSTTSFFKSCENYNPVLEMGVMPYLQYEISDIRHTGNPVIDNMGLPKARTVDFSLLIFLLNAGVCYLLVLAWRRYFAEMPFRVKYVRHLFPALVVTWLVHNLYFVNIFAWVWVVGFPSIWPVAFAEQFAGYVGVWIVTKFIFVVYLVVIAWLIRLFVLIGKGLTGRIGRSHGSSTSPDPPAW